MALTIAVGSRREPKLAGVRAALERLATLPWPPGGAVIHSADVPSGEAATPIGDEATIAGARRRARGALGAIGGASLALGLEGGVVVVPLQPPIVLLRNWAAAFDGTREAFGSGPAVQLPADLAGAVLEGEDLASAIDRYAREHDVRSRQGTFGVLTHDLVTRADAFTLAVLVALAPWYNSRMGTEGRG
jgi:inosine/xanthosine triphosphatase